MNHLHPIGFFVIVMSWWNNVDSGIDYWYIVHALFIMIVQSMTQHS